MLNLENDPIELDSEQQVPMLRLPAPPFVGPNISRLIPQPASELVHHQPGRDIGRVDGAAGGTPAGLSFGLREDCGRVMTPAALTCDSK